MCNVENSLPGSPRTAYVGSEYDVIYSGLLISGMPYQRHVDERKVNDLIRHWDPQRLDPLAVNCRDGNFYLVDGQNRVMALRKMNGGDVMVLCRLYHNLSYQEEAKLCFELDKAKQRLTLAQSVQALLEAGTDETVLDIRSLIEENGFRWTLGKMFPGEYEISAVKTVIDAYRLLGRETFDRMLYLTAQAWRGAPCSLKGSFISGLALFLKVYDKELTDRAAIRRLSAINPEEVVRRGKLDFSTNRASLRYARSLWRKFNQRGSRKLEYKLETCRNK